MAKEKMEKVKREPLIHVSKRSDLPVWQAMLIRLAVVLGALVFILLLSSAVLSKDPGTLIKYVFTGTFGSEANAMVLFRDTALLLMIALAITPAFKMKFWNIGAEGQVLISAFACCATMWYFGGKMPDAGLIVVMLIFSMLAGVFWSVIPAIFKAIFNTNETLFTLMMNYLAIQVVRLFIKYWKPTGSGIIDAIPYGNLPQFGALDHDYWFSIVFAIATVAFMFVYLKYSKHGYELTVVGESERTAKYIGINVKKVIIRTLIVGGLVCGVVGFLLVGGIDHSISDATVGGRGFTAVLVSWLAQFNPLIMVGVALLVVFINKGMIWVMQSIGVTNDYFSKLVIGLLFLIIIAGEFIIRYKVTFRGHKSKEKVGRGKKVMEGLH